MVDETIGNILPLKKISIKQTLYEALWKEGGGHYFAKMKVSIVAQDHFRHLLGWFAFSCLNIFEA